VDIRDLAGATATMTDAHNGGFYLRNNIAGLRRGVGSPPPAVYYRFNETDFTWLSIVTAKVAYAQYTSADFVEYVPFTWTSRAYAKDNLLIFPYCWRRLWAAQVPLVSLDSSASFRKTARGSVSANNMKRQRGIYSFG
jgi:hypothetical protein